MSRNRASEFYPKDAVPPGVAGNTSFFHDSVMSADSLDDEELDNTSSDARDSAGFEWWAGNLLVSAGAFGPYRSF